MYLLLFHIHWCSAYMYIYVRVSEFLELKTDNCGLSYRCWELNLGPSEEHECC